MAPTAIYTSIEQPEVKTNGKVPYKITNGLRVQPLKYSGSLDHLKYTDVTPILGREYDVQLKDILNSPQSERMLKDLAIQISERGVLIFRAQDLDIASQKRLTDEVGRLAGRPADHSLHINPIFRHPDNAPCDDAGTQDPMLYVLNSKVLKNVNKHATHLHKDVPEASDGWHSDGTFENCPNDYSCLMMYDTPQAGGDTMFASACGMYERLSPAFQAFLETLQCEGGHPMFRATAAELGFEIWERRGSPLNVGDAFSSTHPVVRTNPVTGWKSIYGFGVHCKRILGVSAVESQLIDDYIRRLLTHNHDLQCRMHWGPGDVAIWDNRSTFHSATRDVPAGSLRRGNRASSTGEVPYLDPKSKSRSQALAEGF